MRIAIVAAGRAKPGPERDLYEDFLARFDALGRSLALGPATLIELDARKIGADPDAALLARVPDGYVRIALDERGDDLTSPKMAKRLQDWRDSGRPGAAFLIGAADGHGATLRSAADATIAFGAATWPHMLVRVLLAEQLYRAASICANHPYHRGG